MLATNCLLHRILQEATGKMHPCTTVSSEGLHSLDVVWSKSMFLENFPNRYLQQLQFFARWFRDLLLLFSIWELLENTSISQQALISGRVLTGTAFAHLSVYYIPS
jgi:hypothetical protein